MRKILGLFLLAALLAGADRGRAEPAFSARRLADGAEILTPEQAVLVEFESDRIVHVTKRPRDAGPARPSLIILPGRGTPLVSYAEEPDRIVLGSGALRVSVARGDGAVSWSEPSGAPILEEIGGAQLTPAAEPGTCSASVRFKLKPDEGIYGLGQHQSGLMDYRGHTVTLVQSNTQSAIPFLVSTRGYGILWDNYSKTVVADSPAGCSFWSEIGEGADYHFIYGGSIDGAIAGYRRLTGAAPLYGKWAYGYFQSKEHYASREELLRIAAEYRARHLPIDCLVQDWDYWGDSRDSWNGMTFDPGRYPRPTEMIDALHREHLHFMISIWCGFGPGTAVYRDLDRRGMLYPTVGWAGFRYYDAYNPAATDLYWKYLNQGLFRHGVDGWWMDST
ncbi:MAG TPA: TIM-barrel domain-containing protein, partial [Opitutaceae bacterium]|nr:TIM-barrel domain-containing protein [Opitutaceae bacterium]